MKLTFASFLSPNLETLYRAATGHVGRRLGISTELVVGSSYEEFGRRKIDAGFICGLPYVRLAGGVHAVAAPVVDGPRYRGRPVYFSDVVARADHPAQTFADLRGASWCYNEPDSHSGYMTVLHHLVRLGETPSYFRRFDAVGFHLTSLRLVAEGSYDASAIDSHVMAVCNRRDPDLLRGLKVIESIGPSTIQPVVVADHVPPDVREAIAGALVDMHERSVFDQAVVAGFVRVCDSDYDDIRAIAATVAAAERRLDR